MLQSIHLLLFVHSCFSEDRRRRRVGTILLTLSSSPPFLSPPSFTQPHLLALFNQPYEPTVRLRRLFSTPRPASKFASLDRSASSPFVLRRASLGNTKSREAFRFISLKFFPFLLFSCQNGRTSTHCQDRFSLLALRNLVFPSFKTSLDFLA